jgi:hypothetical protein
MLFYSIVIPWVIVWFGGTVLLGFRYRAKRRAYLQRFPAVEGVPLDMFVSGGPSRVRRAIYRAMWQRQADPDLERLRRTMWRRLLYLAVWIVGFFLILNGVIASLIAAGALH